MASIGVQSPAVNHNVALTQALRGVPGKMRLRHLDNGTGIGKPCAPCGTTGTHGTHQQRVHAEALSAAVGVMKEARNAPSASSATQRKLDTAVARLCDRGCPPYGARVINQLTALGAVHAGIVSALEGDPDNAALLRCEQGLRAAIVNVGRCAGAIEKHCVDGFLHADDGRSRVLAKALGDSDQAITRCRKVMGDAALLASVAASVMSTAMLDSITERLPAAAAYFRGGASVDDIVEVMAKGFSTTAEHVVNHLLESGDPRDFQTALLEFLKLPEYVVHALGEAPQAPQPPAPADTPTAAGPGLQGAGSGNQVVGNNGNQTMTGGNITVTTSMGDTGRQLRDMYNQGRRDGRKLGRMEAENTSLRDKLARTRAKNDLLKEQLKERVDLIRTGLLPGSDPHVVNLAVSVLSQAQAASNADAGAGRTVEHNVAVSAAHALGPVDALRPALQLEWPRTAPLALPASAVQQPGTPMQAVMRELRHTLSEWQAGRTPQEPASGVVRAAGPTPGSLGIGGTGNGDRAGSSTDVNPADAVMAELKRSFASLPARAAAPEYDAYGQAAVVPSMFTAARSTVRAPQPVTLNQAAADNRSALVLEKAVRLAVGVPFGKPLARATTVSKTQQHAVEDRRRHVSDLLIQTSSVINGRGPTSAPARDAVVSQLSRVAGASAIGRGERNMHAAAAARALAPVKHELDARVRERAVRSKDAANAWRAHTQATATLIPGLKQAQQAWPQQRAAAAGARQQHQQAMAAVLPELQRSAGFMPAEDTDSAQTSVSFSTSSARRSSADDGRPGVMFTPGGGFVGFAASPLRGAQAVNGVEQHHASDADIDSGSVSASSSDGGLMGGGEVTTDDLVRAYKEWLGDALLDLRDRTRNAGLDPSVVLSGNAPAGRPHLKPAVELLQMQAWDLSRQASVHKADLIEVVRNSGGDVEELALKLAAAESELVDLAPSMHLDSSVVEVS